MKASERQSFYNIFEHKTGTRKSSQEWNRKPLVASKLKMYLAQQDK